MKCHVSKQVSQRLASLAEIVEHDKVACYHLSPLPGHSCLAVQGLFLYADQSNSSLQMNMPAYESGCSITRELGSGACMFMTMTPGHPCGIRWQVGFVNPGNPSSSVDSVNCQFANQIPDPKIASNQGSTAFRLSWSCWEAVADLLFTLHGAAGWTRVVVLLTLHRPGSFITQC